jgi:hypothetical protein
MSWSVTSNVPAVTHNLTLVTEQENWEKNDAINLAEKYLIILFCL